VDDDDAEHADRSSGRRWISDIIALLLHCDSSGKDPAPRVAAWGTANRTFGRDMGESGACGGG
jgi:hypothetical protein